MARIYSAPYGLSNRLRCWSLPYGSINCVVPISDMFAILLANTTSRALYYWVSAGTNGEADKFDVFSVIFGALLLPCFASRSLYEPKCTSNPRAAYSAIVICSSVISAFVAGVFFILDASPAIRLGHILLFSIVTPALIIIQRIVVARCVSYAFKQDIIRGRTIVLIRQSNDEIAQASQDYARLGYHVSKLFVVPPRSDCISPCEHWTAFAQQVAAYIERIQVDEVHIAVDWGHWQGVKSAVAELQRTLVAVRLLPDATATEVLRHSHVNVPGDVAFEILRPPLTRAARARKRMFDIALSILGLAITAPIFLVIAFAIRLDSRGPVFFRQTRRGFKDSVFRIYKFRTMTVLEDGPVVNQVTRNDPRVTRVGRWLRRTSLDELPQLLNVLKGDMSLVGPRPHALVHDFEFSNLVSSYALRSYVKPGITGWAQIHDMRGEVSTPDSIRQRVEMDIQYVKNQSLLLDIEILVKTFSHLIRHYNSA